MTKGAERTLVLVRHGQSEWNEQNLFTGWHDVALTPRGIDEARDAGRKLKEEGFKFDIAFTSKLRRAQDTLTLILAELGQSDIPVIQDEALNERNYGDLTGLNKADAQAKWGEEQVRLWRRSYELNPPGGESLKDTAARVLPYFKEKILPEILAGETVLVSAHGNSLRALIMYLDGFAPDEIEKFSLPTGVPRIYRLNENGTKAEVRDLAK
ncbi:2,3-bisphosphoglycerate-dependent phosphoglycerate mutase [Methyloligella sp. 2.7D]|uniref:2,3-bisphosphoglycerate-dependent phosphoglycerate mutase n=1 Tax=unclassified Methyloligella TaxID=2625955 RepID=UPI00157BEF6A|nr:2,3-bisphosphoglycerate-dependent phosphoglycerate mutase [Methyloligella sp. GL2]QKP76303.1 2,3-bisphosphoglycerate-dependent phosphoglycerate mutase [Methyloligella sp. GL2]